MSSKSESAPPPFGAAGDKSAPAAGPVSALKTFGACAICAVLGILGVLVESYGLALVFAGVAFVAAIVFGIAALGLWALKPRKNKRRRPAGDARRSSLNNAAFEDGLCS